MKYKLTEACDRSKGAKKVEDLEVGQLARINDDELKTYNGEIVLVGDDAVVSLTNPEHSWTHKCALLCDILPSGSAITLTVQ